jgi:hypothetical protein
MHSFHVGGFAMTPVTIEPELIAKLTSNGGKVPLINRDGKVIGFFVSPDRLEMLEKVLDEFLDDEPTEEEIREALADPRRYTTKDVMKLLESE